MTASLIRQYGSITATAIVCLGLFLAAGIRYEGFFSVDMVVSLVRDNAFLGIAAVGVTFVILAGGIDLSVGAMVGCSSIIIATLVEHAQWHPIPAILVALLFGATLGASMGALIHYFALPPFIVTLAGMFFARGMGFVIHQESIAIRHGFYDALADLPRRLADAVHLPAEAGKLLMQYAPPTAIIFLGVLLIAMVIAHWTRFGRNVYAIGGNEESARLMGLPVAGTKIGAYALSGFCSALAGAVYSLYTFSGNPTAGSMLELDAIAAAVIGGTLLSGGVGYVAGTLLGVLIFGIIRAALDFEGTLSSWWTSITVGVLLLVFILLQRLLQRTVGGGETDA